MLVFVLLCFERASGKAGDRGVCFKVRCLEFVQNTMYIRKDKL
jgi:hypothetical protein